MQAGDAKATGGAQERRDDAEMFTVQQLRAMEQPSWNEGRLDDLNKRVDGGFERMDEEFRFARGETRRGFEKVDEEFKAVRSEMKEGFAKVDEEFKVVRGEMKEEFNAVRGEMSAGFDRLFWKLVSTGLSVVAAAFALAQLL
jgi:hypothetical protein